MYIHHTSSSTYADIVWPPYLWLCTYSVVFVEITEAGYQQTEEHGHNMIKASVSYNRDLANDIIINFYPVTYDRYFNELGLTLPPGQMGDEFEAQSKQLLYELTIFM